MSGSKNKQGSALHRFALVDMLRGLRITGRHFFAKKVTDQYPEKPSPVSRRFRGVLALRSYDNGRERCIACKLCEATCPALAITIDVETLSDGSRRPSRFDIDAFKCINCGLCEEACPVDSIVTVPDGEYVVEKRGDNIFTKDMLIALGKHYEDTLAQNIKDEEAYR